MNVLNAVKTRRSIRKYKSKVIPIKVIAQLKESLIWAPSAGNLQSRRFFFITDEESKLSLVEASYNQKFILEAPLVIVACADIESSSVKYSGRGKGLYSTIDASVSVQNLLLVAHENGLGTCWVGGFEEGAVRKALNLKNNLLPIAIVPVGYPNIKPDVPGRVKTEEAVVEM